MTAEPVRRGPGRPPKLAAVPTARPVLAVPVKAPLRTLAGTLDADADRREADLSRYVRAEELYIRRLREQADALRNAANSVPESETDRYLALPEAAKRLRISTKQLTRWITAGRLPVLRDPATGAPRLPYRLRVADVDAMFRGAP